MDSEHIIRLAGEHGISTGKGPTGIAAAAIYIAAMKNGKARKRAEEILKMAIDNDLTSGKGPTGVAAAAIYIASVNSLYLFLMVTSVTPATSAIALCVLLSCNQ